MAVPGLDSYGARSGFAPPYEESRWRAILRHAAVGIGAGFGAGLGAVPRGANFGTAFLAAAGGSSKAAQTAQMAAQEYAMKQSEAQQKAERDALTAKMIEAETARMSKPDKPEKTDVWNRSPEEVQRYLDLKKQEMALKPVPVKGGGMGGGKMGAGPEDSSFMDSLVKTTRSGHKFLDASGLLGKDKGLGIRYAAGKKIPVVGSADMGQLQDIDAARGNIVDMTSSVQSLLPKDAQGRAAAYPGIKLSQILQTNAQRAAFSSYRAAAIRNLRAIAGSKGLRINQAEIALAVKNDIPEITDTWDVAQQKMANVSKMLDNAEKPLVTSNWGQTAPSPMATQADRDYVKSLGIK